MLSPCATTRIRRALVVVGFVGFYTGGAGARAIAQSTTEATQATAHTVIDGARRPELIPEWFRWEKLLRRVGEAAQAPESTIATFVEQTLKLGPTEVQILRQEAKLHAERERLLKEKMKATMDAVDRNGKTPEQVQAEILAALADLDMEGRQEILNARERVVARLSPESLQLLTSWIETHVVATTRVFLDPRDANRFHLPW